jgi:hypothetical protein
MPLRPSPIAELEAHACSSLQKLFLQREAGRQVDLTNCSALREVVLVRVDEGEVHAGGRARRGAGWLQTAAPGGAAGADGAQGIGWVVRAGSGVCACVGGGRG